MTDFTGTLDEDLASKVWGAALAHGGDFAEIFLEDTERLSFRLKDGVISDVSRGHLQGVGVRVVSGGSYGYGWLDGLDEAGLLKAARVAAEIASDHPSGVQPARRIDLPDLYPVEQPLQRLELTAKTKMAQDVDTGVRAHDSRVQQVNVLYSESLRVIRVLTSDGRDVRDEQPLVRMAVQVVAVKNGKRARGFRAYGGRVGADLFTDQPPVPFFLAAAEMALVNLEARTIKGGPMQVVLGPGWGGVLLHESVGHGLEGDFNFKKASLFSGRLGQKVASDLVTVVDDATIPHHRGSLNIDDEGTPGSRKVLIENGVLRRYMVDRISARQLGHRLTGNGRRESYRYPPIPRMTNTFMLDGSSDPEEIIRSTAHGLFAKTFGGGQVDISNGNFVFEVMEGYRIENGKLTHPVESAILIGNGPEALGKVDMVGNDFSLDTGVGTCGKNGQQVPVGVGEPTLRISEMTVGGRG
ncbi:MAG: hypothetical protein B1H03_00545 [Planctomycetales bacterium 4484_113]|nr:MAG: hypothetical protein B1H03_00545 [Planctomycetales bacterium 4484_113]